METMQVRWKEGTGWGVLPEGAASADGVLVFGDSPYFRSEACYADLRRMFPGAHLFGCSSSGSVFGTEISDGDVVASAFKLGRSSVRLASVMVDAATSSEQAGRQLMDALQADDLRHVVVLADGLQVNGSDLARGLNSSGVPVTGGLAGDGTRFGKTWVMADGPARTGQVSALGFYGEITIKSGCFAGWEEFGAERLVTRSAGNVVYEIDKQPALDLYKKYLGELAAELPASGLRFPLSIQQNKSERPLIRTLLAVDESAHSLTFAGDVPEGYLCKLMRTDLDGLIESAGLAAQAAHSAEARSQGLCLVVSCVGRRLVMGQLTEDELEIVQDTLGDGTAVTGFYSYGELAPFSDVMLCQLHNQTMTLTSFYE
ncbi:MAG: FIST N-terminal domain-containing protein [Sideroxydans sp.]|nr:FIST N-terminal domain-containing protein [Sideroxydans sp.]